MCSKYNVKQSHLRKKVFFATKMAKRELGVVPLFMMIPCPTKRSIPLYPSPPPLPFKNEILGGDLGSCSTEHQKQTIFPKACLKRSRLIDLEQRKPTLGTWWRLGKYFLKANYLGTCYPKGIILEFQSRLNFLAVGGRVLLVTPALLGGSIRVSGSHIISYRPKQTPFNLILWGISSPQNILK